MSDPESRILGMHRRISRRDFLNGMAIGITAACAPGFGLAMDDPPQATAEAAPAGEYPPLRSGLRGNDPAAVAWFGALEQGEYAHPSISERDIREEYDLVIVGAGISGLAAAYFYRSALGPDPRILILDNHDDLGGHARRNEFRYRGRTYLGFGGTINISSPYPYSYAAKALVKELGIDVGSFPQYADRDLETKYQLVPGIFFDQEHFGENRLLPGYGRLPWAELFARAPLSAAARKDLLRLHSDNPDYMAGLEPEEKRARLARMSYQDYLLKVAGMSPEALPFFLGRAWRNNKRVDTVPALEAAQHGAVGFNGLGLHFEHPFQEDSYFFRFPDGNASVARLLVARLVPQALGSASVDSVVNARLDYSRLDVPASGTRIRLSSTVVRVQHAGRPGSPSEVRIAYLENGRMRAVRARYCILACYNRLIPALMPELPGEQKEALADAVKVPMLYTNVLIKRWKSFQELGVMRITAPGMPYTTVALDAASRVGGYQAVTTPEEPIVVFMIRNPNRPGLPRKEQNRLGQQELLSTTFEQFELETRRQLARMLAAGGFDPAEDIAAITVNRWPYGYAYTYDSLADPEVAPEERPHVTGRRRFGRVAIANSDAGAAAFTNQAIDEAHRAVQELLVLQGLT